MQNIKDEAYDFGKYIINILLYYFFYFKLQ